MALPDKHPTSAQRFELGRRQERVSEHQLAIGFLFKRLHSKATNHILRLIQIYTNI